MKAICLTYDKNIRVMEFVLECYQRLWPENPFIFRVPYNEIRPLELQKKFKGKIELIQTPSPIRGTIETLIEGLDENEWVWWCMDDKYPMEVMKEEMAAIYNLICDTNDPDVWGVMVTRNDFSDKQTVSSIFGSKSEPFLRKKNYKGFFQPHFVRVGILRKYLVENGQKQEPITSRVGNAGFLWDAERALYSPFPIGKKVFLAKNARLAFGETMTNGALTVNCVNDMEIRNFSPPNFPRHSAGWYSTLAGGIEHLSSKLSSTCGNPPAQSSLDHDQLLGMVNQRKEKNTIILTFGNNAYSKIIDNWVAHVKELRISNYIVISLDQKLSNHLASQNVPHILVSCNKGLKEIWRLRMSLVLRVLSSGTGVILSDADAIWLEDPHDDLLNGSVADLLISQGTVWPPKAFNTWGFVLCCGFFYAAPTPRSIKLFEHITSCNYGNGQFDDQQELNLEILRNGIKWQNDEPVTINLQGGKNVTASKNRIIGISENLRVEVLPFTLYQRPFIDKNRGKVIHPLSPKKQLGTIETLLKLDLWKDEHNPSLGVKETISKQGFWFVDVPRTSSSSIRAELSHNFGIINGKKGYIEKDMIHAVPQIIQPHRTASEMRDRLGTEIWSQLYTFGFVRNPYERIWSLYCYLTRGSAKNTGESFSDFVASLKTWRKGRPIPTRSAFDYLSDEQGRIIVTRVCRFENRSKELLEVGEVLNMKFTGVLSQDVARHKESYSKQYDNKMKRTIESLFARDFELGGYSLDL